jgi:hypothetical protein
MPLHLEPGKTIKRTSLHRRYGGRQQGGISPSRKSPHVFLFTDPKRGEQHGYIFDGQRKDGLYDYTGEGQSGDQEMVQGNRTIRDHKAEGRELHLFDASAKKLIYVGQYEYVGDYTADAPQKGSSEKRSVIVFRLRPLGTVAPIVSSPLERLDRRQVKAVPVERQLTEETLAEPSRGPYTVRRREQKLVHQYEARLLDEGHEVCRLRLWPKGEPAPFLSDLFDRTTNTLIEAKGSIARPAFRMAIGQLADYARLVKPAPRRAILLPEKPRVDLIRLAHSQGVVVIWAEGDGFVAKSPAARGSGG